MNVLLKAHSLACRLGAWDKRLTASLTLPPRARALRLAATIGTHLGDGLLWAAVGVLAYILSGAQERRAIWAIALTVLAAGAIVSALKLLVRRQRPSRRHASLYRCFDAYSFPSGHACRIFCLAVLFPSLQPVSPIPLLLLATWVSLSRVLLSVHHISDVLVGGVIGCLAGCMGRCLFAALGVFR